MSAGYRIVPIADVGTVKVNVGNADGGVTAVLTPQQARECGSTMIVGAQRATLLQREADEIAAAADRIRAKYRGEAACEPQYEFTNDPPARLATQGPLRLLGVKHGVVHVSFACDRGEDKPVFEDGSLEPDEATRIGELLICMAERARQERQRR